MSVYRQTGGPRVRIWPDGTGTGIDVSPIVESFNTSKSLGAPTGRWSVRLQPSLARGSRSIFDAGGIERLVRPNAVVSIGWDRPGGIMLGLVSSISRSRGWSGGGDTITLSGEDFGKVLVNDAIVRANAAVQDYDLFVDKIQAIAPGTSLTNQLGGTWGPDRWDGGNAFAQATVAEVVKWVLETVTTTRIPMLAGFGSNTHGTIGNFMFGAVTPSWNDGRIQNENLWTYTGSVWGFLSTVIDADFYEVFVDTYAGLTDRSFSQGYEVIAADALGVTDDIPGTAVRSTTRGPSEQQSRVGDTFFRNANAVTDLPDVALVIRPKPFDEGGLAFLDTTEVPGLTWEDLRTAIHGYQHHVIPADAVLSESITVNDAEVYSYFNVSSNYDIVGNPIAASEGLFFPAIDLYALKNHGVRALQGSYSLLGSNVAERESDPVEFGRKTAGEVLEFRNRLFNWYRLNAWFESGSITVVGADHLRVGDPVFLPWKVPMCATPKAAGINPRGMRYYCTATQHTWSYGGTYTTTLQLERGHNAALIEQASFDIRQFGAAIGMPSMIAALPDTKLFEAPR